MRKPKKPQLYTQGRLPSERMDGRAVVQFADLVATTEHSKKTLQNLLKFVRIERRKIERERVPFVERTLFERRTEFFLDNVLKMLAKALEPLIVRCPSCGTVLKEGRERNCRTCACDGG